MPAVPSGTNPHRMAASRPAASSMRIAEHRKSTATTAEFLGHGGRNDNRPEELFQNGQLFEKTPTLGSATYH